MTTRPSPSFANLARFPQPARRRRARPTAAMLIACLMLFAGPVLAGGGDGGDGGSGGMESAAPASIAGAQAAGPAEVTRLMGDQGERVLVIDVRPKPAFERGHLAGAIRLEPRRSEVTRSYQVDRSVLGSDKSRPVVVYGANANDPAAAAVVRAAVAEGFANVIWMRGGFAEWVSARLPVRAS